MWNWLHHLVNPHCVECKVEARCQNCDTLLLLLENERRDKNKLLETLCAPREIIKEVEVEKTDYSKIPNRPLTWEARRRILEEAERADKQVTVVPLEKLEKELLG
jgi:hypothetical protein